MLTSTDIQHKKVYSSTIVNILVFTPYVNPSRTSNPSLTLFHHLPERVSLPGLELESMSKLNSSYPKSFRYVSIAKKVFVYQLCIFNKM